MPKIILAVLISLVAGFVLGAWLSDDVDVEHAIGATTADNLQPLEERLLSLEQLIAEERQARLRLEERLQELIEERSAVVQGDPPLMSMTLSKVGQRNVDHAILSR